MKNLLYLFFATTLLGCGSDAGSIECPEQPLLTTYEVSQINYDINSNLASAVFTAEIQNIQLGANCETLSVTNQGFVYGLNIQPKIDDNVVNVNGQNPSFTANNLIAETTYYVGLI